MYADITATIHAVACSWTNLWTKMPICKCGYIERFVAFISFLKGAPDPQNLEANASDLKKLDSKIVITSRSFL